MKTEIMVDGYRGFLLIDTCRNNGTERFDEALGMEECGRIPGGILEPWGDKKVFDELIFYKRL